MTERRERRERRERGREREREREGEGERGVTVSSLASTQQSSGVGKTFDPQHTHTYTTTLITQ